MPVGKSHEYGIMQCGEKNVPNAEVLFLNLFVQASSNNNILLQQSGDPEPGLRRCSLKSTHVLTRRKLGGPPGSRAAKRIRWEKQTPNRKC
jgi:hypothetical protein